MSLADLRRDYRLRSLNRGDLHDDPLEQFRHWFSEAQRAEVLEPNAMTLATATPDGRPSARVVLLKGFDPSGFVFYTNYTSRKGEELEHNPYAALVFNWLELERQVRIEGRVERVTREVSLAYFRSRPLGSQLGALVSPQSQPIENRAVLEARYAELEQQYAEDEVPLPDTWGGYRVLPERLEFWQGRSGRLHDRFEYGLVGDSWQITRLAP